MKNKLLALFLSLTILVSVIPEKILATDLTDMEEDWAKEVLERAVENGLLRVERGSVRGKDYLTRAEMATILNRCFNAKVKVSLNSFDDISENDWYYEEMEKAFGMGVFQGDGKKLNPKKEISREEVFVVLSRAFKLLDENEIGIGNFTDSDEISPWAKDEVAALVSQGYISGSDGKLNPKKNITRAEFAKLMDNLVKTYINSSGEYSEDYKGNIIINKEGVVLKGSTVEGNIIIADGVGEGEVILEDVNLKGKLLLRGGAKDSIIIKGNSKIENIIAVNSKDSNIVYYENVKPKEENIKVDTKPETKEKKKRKRSSSTESKEEEVTPEDKEEVEEPKEEEPLPEDKDEVELIVKSVQALNSNKLKVILSDHSEHEIVLEEPLKDGIKTEVEFTIDEKEYKADVIWDKPVVELIVKSVEVLDSCNLKVILSDKSEHNIELKESLKDGKEIEVKFKIGEKEYEVNVIWNKPEDSNLEKTIVKNEDEFVRAVKEGSKNIILGEHINLGGYMLTNRLYYGVDDGIINLGTKRLTVKNESFCLSGNRIKIENGIMITKDNYALVISGEDIIIDSINITGGIKVIGKQIVNGTLTGESKSVNFKMRNCDVSNVVRAFIVYIDQGGPSSVIIECGSLTLYKTAFKILKSEEGSIIIKDNVKIIPKGGTLW